MKKIIIFMVIVLSMIGVVEGATIGIGTEFWSDVYGGHINVTYPFTASYAAVVGDQINITSDAYQVINTKSLNDSVGTVVNWTVDAGYLQVFNQTSVTAEADNVIEWTQNISALNRSIVVNYEATTHPKFSEIALTVDKIVNYTLSSSEFSFFCYGTGNVKVTNLDYVKGATGNYKVNHNLVSIETTNTNTYTATCDNTLWQFYKTTSSSDLARVSPSINNGMVVFASGLSLIILALIFSVIVGIYQQRKENGKIDWGGLIKNTSIIVGIMLILLMGLAVISVMINTL